MSAPEAFFRGLTGEALLRLWAAEDRAAGPQAGAFAEDLHPAGGTEAPALRLSQEDIDRVAQALCRRLLDAAGNM